MIGKITISKEQIVDNEVCVITQDGTYDYECNVYNDKKENIDKILTKKTIIEAAKQQLIVAEMDPETLGNEIEIANNLLNDKTDILKTVEYVEIEYELEEIKEYIEKNPILKTKKIILPDVYNLTYKSIYDIEKVFKACPYIYIKVPGNQLPINIETFKKTLKKIDAIVKNIKRLDLSPIEQAMFAYDVVKDREYQAEEQDESKYLSRDVSLSLLGDKIVCSGYSNIFKTILDKLGIKNEVYLITDHQRNMAYIKDEKYNIEGVYYFDATWDSKKIEQGNAHFNRYLFFAKTKYQIDKHSKAEDETLPYFYGLLSSEEYFDFMDSKGLVGANLNMISTINRIARFVEGKPLIPYFILIDKEDKKCTHEKVMEISTKNIFEPEEVELDKVAIEEKLCEYLDLFANKIDAQTMIKILYNVRKKQWYLNPEKYPFDKDEIIKTVLNSKWSFQNDEDIDIIAIITGKAKRRTIMEEVMDSKEYIEKENMDRDIERVKVAKTLRRVLESKKQN